MFRRERATPRELRRAHRKELAHGTQDRSRSRPCPGGSASRRRLGADEADRVRRARRRSEEHTSELQSRLHLVCRLLLEKKKTLIRHVTKLLSRRQLFGCRYGTRARA